MTSARPALQADAAAHWATLVQTHPVRPSNVMRQLTAAARFRAPVQAPACPLLLIASAGDALVSPRCSQAIARAWALPLIEHPWAGHDLALDDAPWLVSQLVAWGAPSPARGRGQG